VLSGRGLCDELITRPEESYRLCCIVVCDLVTSRMGSPYIYDISRLRVKHSSERNNNTMSLLTPFVMLQKLLLLQLQFSLEINFLFMTGNDLDEETFLNSPIQLSQSAF